MRVPAYVGNVSLLLVLFYVQHSMGDDCPFTCSVDSDCQSIAMNVGAEQTCMDGCCRPSPGDFSMVESETATEAASLVTARLTIALISLLYAFVL